MTDLREKAQALLAELDGNEYLTHKVIDSARIRDARNALRAALAEDTVCVPREPMLWLWKNRPNEFWAFDNPYPCYDNGDPMTLGEPVGYALLKQSINGRPEVTHSDAVRTMLAAAEKEPRP